MIQNKEVGPLSRTTLIAAALGVSLVTAALSSSIGMELLRGWLTFAVRVIPKVKVRWDGLVIFTLGFLLACALTHCFLQWLVRESQLKRSAAIVPWRLSSSVSLVAIVLLIFAIGISMAGIVHQVGWIMNSPKSLYVGEIQSEEDAQRSPYRPELVATTTHASWIFESLPFIHYMWLEIDRSQPWNSELNKSKVKGLVIEALCPSQGYPYKSPDGLGLTHVVGNLEVTECGRKLRLSDIEDTSQTILAGEIQVGFSPWAMPDNGRPLKYGIRHDWSHVANDSLGFGSSHTSGANFVLLDGSVSFLSTATDPKVLEQLGKLKVKEK